MENDIWSGIKVPSKEYIYCSVAKNATAENDGLGKVVL
jgi:hypothetical protein